MKQPKQKHILVADDEKNTLDTLGFILETANFKVDLVKNGREALKKVLSAKDTNSPVDLLVTDLRMPVMSGSELIDALRRFNIDVPVLIITSYDSYDLKEKARQGGNSDFLTKPFGDQEFLAKIKNLFKKSDRVTH